MVMVYTNGWMEETIKVNGFIIKCGEWEKPHGQMEDHMKEGNAKSYESYADDKKHGLGTFIWNDGRKYIG